MSCCSICQEDIATHESFTLDCGHVFHAKCACNHFYVNDNRCPLCRQGPHFWPQLDVNEEEEDNLEEMFPVVTWKHIWKTLCQKSKSDKRLTRMKTTFSKWEGEKKKQYKAYRVAKKKLDKLNKDLKAQVKQFAKTQSEKMKRNNDNAFNDLKQARKHLGIARSQSYAARKRIINKYWSSTNIERTTNVSPRRVTYGVE